jgi:hypothetical protein
MTAKGRLLPLELIWNISSDGFNIHQIGIFTDNM